MSKLPAPRLSRRPRLPLIWIVPLVAAIVAGWMIYRQWSDRGPEITIVFADGSGVEPGKTTLEHKGVAVGLVTGVQLRDDLSGVVVRLRLDRSAVSLAREGSQFWIVHPEIGFSGVSGLDTLVSGVHLNVRPGTGAPASSFRGLDQAPPPMESSEGRAFLLASDRLGTLLPHAPVYYRDVKVGEVETSRLTDDATGVLIRVRIFNPFASLVRTNTRFWSAGGVPVKISLFGAEIQTTSLQSIVTGAIAFATPDDPGPPAEAGTRFPLHDELDKEWLKWHPTIPIEAPNESPEDRPPPKGGLPGLLPKK